MSEEYRDYLCEYPFDGGRWGFTIHARSQEEAEARLKVIGWGEVKGESVGTLPGFVPVWVVRALCWWWSRGQ